MKDSEAKAYFCFQGTTALPMAREGWTAFGYVPECENFWLITADPATPSPIEKTATFGQVIGRQSPPPYR